MMTLSLLLSLVFLVLGGMHLNWALGGKRWFSASLPTKENGERVLNPTRVDSAVVGIGLVLFGIFYLLKGGLIELQLPGWIINFGGWAIPLIFILRAIGEFKYVGLFKSVRKTDFGKRDTKFFSPLCLVIGVCGIIIELAGI